MGQATWGGRVGRREGKILLRRWRCFRETCSDFHESFRPFFFMESWERGSHTRHPWDCGKEVIVIWILGLEARDKKGDKWQDCLGSRSEWASTDGRWA